MIDEAFSRLETSNRSDEPQLRSMRLLAAVERVLCQHLGAEDIDDADASGRRLTAIGFDAAHMDAGSPVVRIPEVRSRSTMPRQVIRYRKFPAMSALKRLISNKPRYRRV